MSARVVQLTDSTLIGLARDPRVRTALPLFEQLYKAIGRGSGCRCRHKHSGFGATLASAKVLIAKDTGLSTRLKALINATMLIIHVREGNKVVKKEV